jgi:hypothetical protein
MSRSYSFKKKHLLQKNYCISRCEKITQYLKGGDILLLLHMITIMKMAKVIALSKLPPCVAKNAWGEEVKFRQ